MSNIKLNNRYVHYQRYVNATQPIGDVEYVRNVIQDLIQGASHPTIRYKVKQLNPQPFLQAMEYMQKPYQQGNIQRSFFTTSQVQSIKNKLQKQMHRLKIPGNHLQTKIQELNDKTKQMHRQIKALKLTQQPNFNQHKGTYQAHLNLIAESQQQHQQLYGYTQDQIQQILNTRQQHFNAIKQLQQKMKKQIAQSTQQSLRKTNMQKFFNDKFSTINMQDQTHYLTGLKPSLHFTTTQQYTEQMLEQDKKSVLQYIDQMAQHRFKELPLNNPKIIQTSKFANVLSEYKKYEIKIQKIKNKLVQKDLSVQNFQSLAKLVKDKPLTHKLGQLQKIIEQLKNNISFLGKLQMQLQQAPQLVQINLAQSILRQGIKNYYDNPQIKPLLNIIKQQKKILDKYQNTITVPALIKQQVQQVEVYLNLLQSKLANNLHPDKQFLQGTLIQFRSLVKLHKSPISTSFHTNKILTNFIQSQIRQDKQMIKNQNLDIQEMVQQQHSADNYSTEQFVIIKGIAKYAQDLDFDQQKFSEKILNTSKQIYSSLGLAGMTVIGGKQIAGIGVKLMQGLNVGFTTFKGNLQAAKAVVIQQSGWFSTAYSTFMDGILNCIDVVGKWIFDTVQHAIQYFTGDYVAHHQASSTIFQALSALVGSFGVMSFYLAFYTMGITSSNPLIRLMFIAKTFGAVFTYFTATTITEALAQMCASSDVITAASKVSILGFLQVISPWNIYPALLQLLSTMTFGYVSGNIILCVILLGSAKFAIGNVWIKSLMGATDSMTAGIAKSIQSKVTAVLQLCAGLTKVVVGTVYQTLQMFFVKMKQYLWPSQQVPLQKVLGMSAQTDPLYLRTVSTMQFVHKTAMKRMNSVFKNIALHPQVAAIKDTCSLIKNGLGIDQKDLQAIKDGKFTKNQNPTHKLPNKSLFFQNSGKYQKHFGTNVDYKQSTFKNSTKPQEMLKQDLAKYQQLKKFYKKKYLDQLPEIKLNNHVKIYPEAPTTKQLMLYVQQQGNLIQKIINQRIKQTKQQIMKAKPVNQIIPLPYQPMVMKQQSQNAIQSQFIKKVGQQFVQSVNHSIVIDSQGNKWVSIGEKVSKQQMNQFGTAMIQQILAVRNKNLNKLRQINQRMLEVTSQQLIQDFTQKRVQGTVHLMDKKRRNQYLNSVIRQVLQVHVSQFDFWYNQMVKLQNMQNIQAQQAIFRKNFKNFLQQNRLRMGTVAFNAIQQYYDKTTYAQLSSKQGFSQLKALLSFAKLSVVLKYLAKQTTQVKYLIQSVNNQQQVKYKQKLRTLELQTLKLLQQQMQQFKPQVQRSYLHRNIEQKKLITQYDYTKALKQLRPKLKYIVDGQTQKIILDTLHKTRYVSQKDTFAVSSIKPFQNVINIQLPKKSINGKLQVAPVSQIKVQKQSIDNKLDNIASVQNKQTIVIESQMKPQAIQKKSMDNKLEAMIPEQSQKLINIQQQKQNFLLSQKMKQHNQRVNNQIIFHNYIQDGTIFSTYSRVQSQIKSFLKQTYNRWKQSSNKQKINVIFTGIKIYFSLWFVQLVMDQIERIADKIPDLSQKIII